MTTRTHFTFRIDTWAPDGNAIVGHVAGMEDYQVRSRLSHQRPPYAFPQRFPPRHRGNGVARNATIFAAIRDAKPGGNYSLYKEMGYDPARWVPIALLAPGPYVLVLRKNFEASKVADLIARAKANPGKITSATPGAGSVGHLATVQLEMLAGITTAQIPYRGLSHALNDLIAGHVDMMFDTPTTSLALHRDGKVKIVAVGTTERVRELPEVPTVAESGLPGYRAGTWYAMVAPPQTPAPLADI